MLKSLIAALLALGLCNASAQDSAVKDNLIRVFVHAQGESVAEFVAAYSTRHGRAPANALQRHKVHAIEQEQRALRERIAPYIATEHSALRVALNGFRVSVRHDQLQTLRRQRGVRAVRPLRSMQPDNVYSVPWVEAPKLWDNIGNGEDVTIAIIDTGIDYTHAGFGGSGNISDFANNDPNVIESGTFPTAKVIGGWDFAGPTYNSREDKDPEPDPDPLDVHGHGSHVAGTAAGIGVPQVVGAGVARGARLLALKVFSDIGGSTDLTVDAIERALDPDQNGIMDDAVDVINMSLGARFGLPQDPSAVAAANAMNAGVIVVASAGNNGDLPYVTGSPGTSPPIITVAAVTPGDRRQIALKVVDGAPTPRLFAAMEGSSSVRIPLVPEIREIALAQSTSPDTDEVDNEACTAPDNDGELAGRLALVVRGSCQFRTKFENLQAAGAAAAIVINSSDDPQELIVMGNLVDGISIPGLMITRAHGQALIEQLNNGVSLVGSLSSAHTLPASPDQNDMLAAFSSRGPGAGGGTFKPDLAAPGRLIFSAAAGSGDHGVQLRGTSMAAPHVAGMAALLRQKHPQWSPAIIKSILKNSAVPSLRDGPGTIIPEVLSRQGAGVMRGAAANLLGAYTSPGSVTFGYLNTVTDSVQTRTIELTNLEPHAKLYTVTHAPAATLAGVAVQCPAEISVAAGGTAELVVSVAIDAAALAADNAQLSFSELSGWCVLDDGVQTLRVAYMASIDGASEIEVQSTTAGATLVNHGPVAGIANGFVLAATQDPPVSSATAISAVGWRESSLFTFPLFELAVVMQEAWENPSNLRWFLFVDTDFDGVSERVLYALDWSNFGFDPGAIITGMDFVSTPADVGSGNHISSWHTEDIDYNDRVVVLPFFMAPSGIMAIFKPGEDDFNFRLVAVDRYGEQSEIHGYIDLRDPQATLHQKYVLLPQEEHAIYAEGATLWLFPTNLDERQALITGNRKQPLHDLQQQEPVGDRHRNNSKPR